MVHINLCSYLTIYIFFTLSTTAYQQKLKAKQNLVRLVEQNVANEISIILKILKIELKNIVMLFEMELQRNLIDLIKITMKFCCYLNKKRNFINWKGRCLNSKQRVASYEFVSVAIYFILRVTSYFLNLNFRVLFYFTFDS